MSWGLALIAVLLPLLITPGVFIAFDLTPKIVALVLGTCVMLWYSRQHVQRIRGLARSSRGRWFLGLLCAQLVSLAIAVALSASPELSLHGSGWRRFGFFTQTSLAMASLFTAAWIAEHKPRIKSLLRMFVGAGAVAAGYGILQYFGWDPLISAQAYQAGEGIYMIVRPPGTLGHADYFAAWLVAVFFAGLALAPLETSHQTQVAARAIAAFAAVAILLSGTRSALLGLAAGCAVLAVMRRPRVTRRSVASAAAVVTCLALFLVSPAGARLRARVHWSTEDVWGGARLLLWRDSLTMAAQRPWTGFGPETFSAQFPAFQSLQLARAYPDFYHESPHNAFLDALTAQGITGLLTMLALAIFGFHAATKLDRDRGAPLVAAWTGLLVCHQFVVFVVPTAVYFYLWLALLAGSAISLEPAPSAASPRTTWAAYAVAAAAGLVLVVYALRVTVADAALASARRAIEGGRVEQAAEHYQKALAWKPQGSGGDLYYSRGMAELAAQVPRGDSQRWAWRQAIEAGRRAAFSAEDRHNAHYSLASLLAAQDDSAGAEQSLRAAIAAAPNWYKPHWTLARLLALMGREREALAEAEAAVERGGSHHEEVLETLRQLQQKSAAKPQ